MISIDCARALAVAGLRWRPVSGDAFRIERAGFESDVFTVNDMTIEPHEFDTGTILGFNGTTEWALDSLALEDALWLPREDQLRALLRNTFRSLHRLEESSHRVLVEIHGATESFDADEAADAYGLALLRLIGLSADA
ncbi:hypothetical protein E3T37_08740 [Cryobacterium sp. TMT2-10]|uniref:Pilus assembly protein CpaE n=1 Tax=Cryobacterium shii TaxID=1259235 RepID=A0AAQ2C821_9MICO|nr:MULTISPECIES: hypothetical protein [Cryobacterium]TFC51287.1 hypothetical protein E3O49_04275 [Cryobacterium shii]TFC85200.1 hypothetical protein E3T24_08665 [Cryobacterium sp. TmT2-59]TFD39075.1 hypothetical protein E3T37_08740 [Cryobacterium sp. TMT2-10]